MKNKTLPKKKLLIHTCCAPCLVAPLKNLQSRFDIMPLWYNPNIHPYTEYQKRLKAFLDFTEKENLKTIVLDEYPLEEFLQKIVFREDNRCRICYYERLKRTFIVAKKGKFVFVTSTLLYSKFQNHNLIVDICMGFAKKYGVKFYYEDFSELWKKGITLSKELNIYRQQYCGCIYSERDRYKQK